MGIMTAADMFQQEMNVLFNDMPFAKVCLDDILTVSHKDKSDHLDKLALVLQDYCKQIQKLKCKNVNSYKKKSNV